MINWFNIPDEGLSNGGLFEVKELEVTENGTYETKGEMYNKVTVNVEGGGGSSDFSTAEVTATNLSSVPTIPQAIHIEDDFLSSDLVFDDNNPVNVTAVLYKGSAHWTVMGNNVVVTGNATTETASFGTVIHITGDCTITIS